jgi:hypothetical protein
MNGDLIEQYLSRLRDELRTPADRTAEVLAEAEDHLRETVAAGTAIGMAEREAQEAAISAFGSVRAVVRAHRRPSSAVVTDVAMAAWKLAAVYLLAVPVAGVLLLIVFYQVLQIQTVAPGPAPHLWIMTRPPDLVSLVAGLSGSAISGLALLLGYRRARRSLCRRGQPPQAPFGAFFPLVGAIFMLFAGPAAGALIAPHVHPLPGGFALLAVSGVAGSVLVALSDVAVMVVMIARQGRDAGTTEQEAALCEMSTPTL